MRRGRTISRLGAGAMLACGPLILGACGSEAPAPAPAPPPVSVEAEQGPVRVRARLDAAEIATHEEVTLSIETEVGSGAVIDEPGGPAAENSEFGGFTVLSIRSTGPRLGDDGRVRTRRDFVLEPFLAGSYTIPPIEVAYRDEGGTRRTLVTEPMTLMVTSVLAGEGDRDLGEMYEITDLPEREPFDWTGVVLWIGGGAVGVLAFVGVIWWFDRRASRRTVFDGVATRINRLRDAAVSDPSNLIAAWDGAERELVRCASERLCPDAPSLSAGELSARSKHWFGLTGDDRAALDSLLTDLDDVRYGGVAIDRSATLAMLDRLEHILRRMRAASDMVVVENA